MTGMKGMGNFTVDFQWKEGKCEAIRIKSHAGADLRVRCARGAKSMSEATVFVDDVAVEVEVDANGIATIPCQLGSTVVIEFVEGTRVVAPNAEKKSSKIYSLDGRQVNKMQSEVVYIVDGKKVMFP